MTDVDDVIVYQHGYSTTGAGVYDWYSLFKRDGSKVGPIGPEGANVDRFLAKRCGLGKAPPSAPVARPKSLEKMPKKCGALTSLSSIILKLKEA